MTSVVEHLSNLIRIPSISSMSNLGVIEYAEQVLQGVGWQTRRQTYSDNEGTAKYNLVACPERQPIEQRDVDIVFVCHTDTVPYSAGWETALIPELKDEKVHGCGACDVKGFLACLLTAAEIVDAKKLARVRIMLTADEEVGCIGAKKLMGVEWLRPSRMVIGEPTQLRAARAGKGYCLGNVTVTGREAHSAHPEKGASAVMGAAHLLIALETFAAEMQRERNDLFSPPFTTLNVGVIRGGSAKNIVPGECSFLIEWRPIPGEIAKRMPALIEEVVEQERWRNAALKYKFSVLREQQGFETAADSELVKKTEGLSGLAAGSIPFGSEASIFSELCDEIVVFGPGDMKTAHSDRECVEIEQLQRAVGCVVSLMLRGWGEKTRCDMDEPL